MKKILSILALCASMPLHAGNLVTTGLDDPHVIPPRITTLSWSGPYAGLSYGNSQHTRTYERTRLEDVIRQEEREWEEHSYWCSRGEGHFGHKCDVTGLTHSPELGSLDLVGSPWNNARDKTVRYSSGYDGLWMGADDLFAFSLPSYVAPAERGDKWAQVGYEHLTGVEVVEVTDTIEVTEEHSVTERDAGAGVFAGYRHQLEGLSVVVGTELNVISSSDHGTLTQLGAQVGLSAGRVLPYAEAGFDHFASGVDVMLGQSGQVLTGVRGWQSFDGENSGVQLRVGFNF